MHTSYRLGVQVCFIPPWSCSTCPHISDQLHTVSSFVRNTTRISSRANCIPSVYRRPTAACETPSADSITHTLTTLRSGYCRSVDSAMLTDRLSTCIDEVSAWMASNRLQLNHAKTEVLWCSSSRQQYQIPSDPVRIGSADVQPVSGP